MSTSITNMKGLRDFIIEEMIALREKRTTPENLNAQTNAAGKVISTVKAELIQQKILGESDKLGFFKLIGDETAKENAEIH